MDGAMFCMIGLAAVIIVLVGLKRIGSAVIEWRAGDGHQRGSKDDV